MTLSISGLHASHGVTRALRDVSLDVEAGQVLALVGANGAGKTTLMHLARFDVERNVAKGAGRAVAGMQPANGQRHVWAPK